MCGIAGIARRDGGGIDEETLKRMANAIRHRGPDGSGVFSSDRVGLAHVRLSIIDIEGGAQPLASDDGNTVVIYNGEIYNYIELRAELERSGHRFRTNTDTEVLVHGYEQWGEAMLHRLNGQFAFALYDRRTERLMLARDRFGVRPLFYAQRRGALYFGSEAKAIFASGEVAPEVDFAGLDEVFMLWGARAPRTPFRGVNQLEPGCYAIWRDGRLRTVRYYELHFMEATEEPQGAIAELDDLMHSSVRLRMRADVPVGGYLSGGLDSSITCALAAGMTPHELRTFSVTFSDPRLDESQFQQQVASAVHSMHSIAHMGPGAIATVFPEVIRHAETPLVRTGPAPMYLLAQLTRENGIKVVLTGEGADELFLGYDLFKETVVREFCLRQPESTMRPRLFDRLYPYLTHGGRAGEFWRQFFLRAGPTTEPLFSHMPRFMLASRIKDFYSTETRVALVGADPLAELRQTLPPGFSDWPLVRRAAYLEMVTLLPSYLLSSQGDRMSLAHGVEGRFPFLDHRLFEFAASLPTSSKLLGLKEKHILRRWAKDVVPATVGQRTKQPYRAPDIPAFFGPQVPEYVRDMLSPESLLGTGIFDSTAVAGLVRRCEAGKATGQAENQALVAILSTQLWFSQFIGRRFDDTVAEPAYRVRTSDPGMRPAAPTL